MSQFNQDFYSEQQPAGAYGQQQGYGQPQQQGDYYAQQQSQGGYPGQHQQGWGEGNWGQQAAPNQGYEIPSGGGYTNQQMMYSQGGGSGGYSGDVMEVDPNPVAGTMGQMTPGDNNASYSDGSGGYGFEDEPPLLEELGIDFSLIKENTMSVLNPLKPADASALSNTDLAGPLLFCLLFGVVLLLTGKVHFGYIYGVGLLGCTSLYIVLNLMSAGGVSIGCIVSVLGYCLLPMVILSLVSVIISLNGILGMPLAFMFICWCSYSASKLFVSVLSMESQQLLVAYPCALIYGVFALLTVF